ncbi:hypothetical protein [Helicobacter sp. 23-1046]
MKQRYFIERILYLVFCSVQILVSQHQEALEFLQKPISPNQQTLQKESLHQDYPDDSARLHYASIAYLHSYMKNHDFSIFSQGVSLQYYNTNDSNRNLFALNIMDTALYNPKDSVTSKVFSATASNIGLFGAFDFSFGDTSFGHHLLGVEIGYGRSLIANGARNQFNEHSALLNVDYGYVFGFGELLLYPFVRVEQYIFFAQNQNGEPKDYGLNAILGIKLMQDFMQWDWWASVGVLSDCNLSGNGIGLLADNSIIYDRDGITNGVLGEIGVNLAHTKHFSLLTKSAISYTLTYYELNIKSAIYGTYRF